MTDEIVTPKTRATFASEYGCRVIDKVPLLLGLREDAEVATHEIGKLFQHPHFFPHFLGVGRSESMDADEGHGEIELP